MNGFESKYIASTGENRQNDIARDKLYNCGVHEAVSNPHRIKANAHGIVEMGGYSYWNIDN